jgi:hypothetical protein
LRGLVGAPLERLDLRWIAGLGHQSHPPPTK